jgi:hypothetical protein
LDDVAADARRRFVCCHTTIIPCGRIPFGSDTARVRFAFGPRSCRMEI